MARIWTRSLMAAAVAASGGTAASAQAQEMVFASWGGAYQEAIRQAWIEPFVEATGIEVIEDTEPEVARVRAMVETGTVEWDVVTGGGATLMRGVALDLYEPITDDMVDQSHVVQASRNEYGVPSEIFSTVIGFSTEAFPPDGPQPETFADFWDVERFPGMRAMQQRPQTMLEAALLADGVPADEIYDVLATPEGFERALDKVRELRDHVAVWWTSGAQPVQALGSGEVVMALGWNGRFQAGMDEGLDIDMAWGESIAQVGYFMIPRGAPNREEAIAFLNFMVTPEAQSRLSEFVAYGPVTEAAWAFIDEERRARLPSTPDRLENSIFLDIAWWADNATEATETYTQMLQE